MSYEDSDLFGNSKISAVCYSTQVQYTSTERYVMDGESKATSVSLHGYVRYAMDVEWGCGSKIEILARNLWTLPDPLDTRAGC